MPDGLITYETIYEILRKEKYETELQKLPPHFFMDIVNYLKEKKSIFDSQKSQNSLFSNEAVKTEKQIQNVKKIIRELYERREHKLLQLALFTSRTTISTDTINLLREEDGFYASLVSLLRAYREGILDNILSLKHPQVLQSKDIKKEPEQNTVLVRFLQAVPRFMGEDLNIYGPFNAEDMANLPPRVANLLVAKKRACEVNYEINKKDTSIL